MVVESVRVHMLSSRHVVILKETGRERYLPIWIGPWEASAIAMRLQGLTPERPLTHDLFASTLEALGVRVDAGRHLRARRRDVPRPALRRARRPGAARSTPGRPTRSRWRSGSGPRSSPRRRSSTRPASARTAGSATTRTGEAARGDRRAASSIRGSTSSATSSTRSTSTPTPRAAGELTRLRRPRRGRAGSARRGAGPGRG